MGKQKSQATQLSLFAPQQKKYDVLKVGKVWKITEDGAIMFPGGPGTDECSARVYAFIWNVWNGPYERGADRCRPLTLQESHNILNIKLRLASPYDSEQEQEEG